MRVAREQAPLPDVPDRASPAHPAAAPEQRRVRLLLVDDSPLFLRGMATLLREEPSIELVGFAENGSEALAQAEQLRPDVVVMDVHLPVQGGIPAASAITARMPDVRVILLSGLWADERGQDVSKDVYTVLSKNVGIEDIVATVLAAAGGQPAPRSTSANRRQGGRRQHGEVVEGDRLTGRELRILSMVAKGYHSARIASELQLKQKTVRNYISVIYDKLGVRGRSQAVLYAARAGLLDELG